MRFRTCTFDDLESSENWESLRSSIALDVGISILQTSIVLGWPYHSPEADTDASVERDM